MNAPEKKDYQQETPVPRIYRVKGPLAPLDEQYYGKPVRTHVRDFGALFGTIFCIIASFQLWKGREAAIPSAFVAGGLLMYLLGVKAPQVLRPVWRAWMGLAHVLGTVMTFLILSICWGLLVIPMSLILRLVGKSVMKTDFRKSVPTYWEDKPEASQDFKLLERQF